MGRNIILCRCYLPRGISYVISIHADVHSSTSNVANIMVEFLQLLTLKKHYILDTVYVDVPLKEG